MVVAMEGPPVGASRRRRRRRRQYAPPARAGDERRRGRRRGRCACGDGPRHRAPRWRRRRAHPTCLRTCGAGDHRVGHLAGVTYAGGHRRCTGTSRRCGVRGRCSLSDISVEMRTATRRGDVLRTRGGAGRRWDAHVPSRMRAGMMVMEEIADALRAPFPWFWRQESRGASVGRRWAMSRTTSSRLRVAPPCCSRATRSRCETTQRPRRDGRELLARVEGRARRGRASHGLPKNEADLHRAAPMVTPQRESPPSAPSRPGVVRRAGGRWEAGACAWIGDGRSPMRGSLHLSDAGRGINSSSRRLPAPATKTWAPMPRVGSCGRYRSRRRRQR